MINTEAVIRKICDKDAGIESVIITPMRDGFTATMQCTDGEELFEHTVDPKATVHAALNALLTEKGKMAAL